MKVEETRGSFSYLWGSRELSSVHDAKLSTVPKKEIRLIVNFK